MTAVAVMAAVGAFALEPVKLNEPDLDRGGSLMRALADRRSVREYADRALSLHVVPEDVRKVAVPVMAHRLVLSRGFGGAVTGKIKIEEILSKVSVPTEEWER